MGTRLVCLERGRHVAPEEVQRIILKPTMHFMGSVIPPCIDVILQDRTRYTLHGDGSESGCRRLAAAKDAEIARLRDVLSEPVACADLRGDDGLPHRWTARMQDAWNEARDIVSLTNSRPAPASLPDQNQD